MIPRLQDTKGSITVIHSNVLLVGEFGNVDDVTCNCKLLQVRRPSYCNELSYTLVTDFRYLYALRFRDDDKLSASVTTPVLDDFLHGLCSFRK